MKMDYFTERGVKQVIETYKGEIGKEFYFTVGKTKHKLDVINKQNSIWESVYYILFQVDNGLSMTIDKFMPRNNFKYNFTDFDTISRQE